MGREEDIADELGIERIFSFPGGQYTKISGEKVVLVPLPGGLITILATPDYYKDIGEARKRVQEIGADVGEIIAGTPISLKSETGQDLSKRTYAIQLHKMCEKDRSDVARSCCTGR